MLSGQYIINLMNTDSHTRYNAIVRILITILALNWTVALIKIAFGVFSRCQSMTADGFHSLTDGASNVMGLFGIRLAYQPKDQDHPYGHKKYETFFSLVIAFLLFILAFSLVHESIERLRNPVVPQVDIKSFAIMLVTLIVNSCVMRYEKKKGQVLHSDILVSDALHTKADIFTSISVIIALIVIKLGYPVLDPVATMIISLFIAHSGYEIIKQGQAVLCDTAVILDEKKLTDIVLGINGVRACHKIRTRGRADDIYIDLHVQVDPDMHMATAHKVSYEIEGAIKKGIPEVSDVVVHMEPKEKD